MKEMKEEINQRLLELCQPLKEGKVKDAMIYSLLAPGKRLRPMLFLNRFKILSVRLSFLYGCGMCC